MRPLSTIAGSDASLGGRSQRGAAFGDCLRQARRPPRKGRARAGASRSAARLRKEAHRAWRLAIAQPHSRSTRPPTPACVARSSARGSRPPCAVRAAEPHRPGSGASRALQAILDAERDCALRALDGGGSPADRVRKSMIRGCGCPRSRARSRAAGSPRCPRRCRRSWRHGASARQETRACSRCHPGSGSPAR
jgi:hypothetical protein